VLDLIGLISFLVVAALIWKRTDVAAVQRAKWSALGFLGLLVPPVLLVLFDVFFPQSAMRFMLAPFVAIAELAVPWVSFAVFTERFPKPAGTERVEQ
jgi:hypothetical protein